MKVAAQAREMRRRTKNANEPYWPDWAKPLVDEIDKSTCAACPRPVSRHNTTNLCGYCQQRAGMRAVSMAVAVRQYRTVGGKRQKSSEEQHNNDSGNGRDRSSK